MLALQRLTAIFEGALTARKKDTTSPLFKINDIDASQRVKIAVSPTRVVNGTTPARAVHPTAITSTTPHTHWRLSTAPARAVTPNTPHDMIRRSAHQKHLTNDIFAETIQHTNHVFHPQQGQQSGHQHIRQRIHQSSSCLKWLMQ
jgi:hypothetical protein